MVTVTVPYILRHSSFVQYNIIYPASKGPSQNRSTKWFTLEKKIMQLVQHQKRNIFPKGNIDCSGISNVSQHRI